MAVGNLLGSNLFNVAILSLTDACYTKGPLLRSVAPINAATAMFAVIALASVVIGLTYRSEKKFLYLAGDGIAICIIYVLATAVLYLANLK